MPDEPIKDEEQTSETEELSDEPLIQDTEDEPGPEVSTPDADSEEQKTDDSKAGDQTTAPAVNINASTIPGPWQIFAPSTRPAGGSRSSG